MSSSAFQKIIEKGRRLNQIIAFTLLKNLYFPVPNYKSRRFVIKT